MNWTIIPQKQGKKEVLCKQIRYFPTVDKKTNEVSFHRLSKPIYQVIVSRGNSHYRIKYNGNYVFQQPDKLVYQNIKLSKRSVPDVLSPKIRVAGDKMTFNDIGEFHSYLNRVLGDVAEKVLDALESALPKQ